MICCKAYRTTPYCPDCGKPIDVDTVKRSLVDYLKRQKITVEKNFQTRLKINPNICEESKKNTKQKIEKWDAWMKWVLSADISDEI